MVYISSCSDCVRLYYTNNTAAVLILIEITSNDPIRVVDEKPSVLHPYNSLFVDSDINESIHRSQRDTANRRETKRPRMSAGVIYLLPVFIYISLSLSG